MKFDNSKQTKKFMVYPCEDNMVRVGYAPVRCLLLSENIVYKDTGEVCHTYSVENELSYFPFEGLLEDYNPYSNIVVMDLYDSYEECKQVCKEKFEKELLKNFNEIAEVREKARTGMDAANTGRREEGVRKKIKKIKKIQKELFKSTDKFYGKSSKSLDGSKAKQVVQKSKNNNKENQGK